MLTHDPASVQLSLSLRPWARQMAARFGYPVFLVGSSLEVPSPRDVDVRVILPDSDFESRYGIHWATWTSALWYGTESAAQMRDYASDMASVSREAARELRLNIDFGVHPASIVKMLWPEHKRLRLDDVPDLPDPMSFRDFLVASGA